MDPPPALFLLRDRCPPDRRAHDRPTGITVRDEGMANAFLLGIDLMDPHRQYNGIFYLEHSPKMHPLQWPACV